METHLPVVFVILSTFAFLVGLAPPLAVFAGTTASECHFPAIFNFGDSNSDTGGLSALFGQAPPPAGETYFHSPAGRYCDGRLIVDFLAESFGLPHLSAHLDSVGSNFSHGANFATASATIRPQSVTLPLGGFSPISLDVQLTEFSDFHRRSQIIRSRGGVYEKLLPEAEHFSKALYTFDIGQNDLAGGYFLNKTVSEVKAYIPDVLTKFKNIVSHTYDQGGRNFWIHNTGPVGCLPYVLEHFPVLAAEVDRVGCATPFNEVAEQFNSQLKDVVVQLRKELPEAAVTYVDIYSLKYELISHATKYGFRESIRACCGHGGKYNYNRYIGCGAKIVVDGKEVLLGKSCKDPSKAIVWDGIHYTEAANKWIFDHILNGSHSDPPIPLKMACHRQPVH